MLAELTIRNFAIIKQLGLTFDPGFNVLTGETGAGKSIIIDAVELLLGGRADSTMIRSGCDSALVEGVFVLNAELQAFVNPLLEREALDDVEQPRMVLLGRELRRNGRNVCRVNGRTVSLGLLREVGQALVDIHGQSEHLSLLRVREHLNLLDRYAGLVDRRAEFAAVVHDLNQVRSELQKLIAGERDAARRSDLLTYQIDEIAAAQLAPGEDQTLREERNRLANAEKLAELAEEALRAASEGDLLDGEPQPSAADLLGVVVEALDKIAHIDAALDEQRNLAQSLVEQVSELARDLQSYRDEIEFSPERLDEVEERLGLMHSLQRKYGDTIEDVLAFAEKAQRDLDQITSAGERIEALRLREVELQQQLGALGAALSGARREAAARLAEGVMAELNDLRMDGAQFAVDFRWEWDEAGAIVAPDALDVAHALGAAAAAGVVPGGEVPRVAFDATGLDRVEFLVAPNPGEGLKPMVKIASGGETARLMLALKGVLARADQTPTLIFDEIDQGIGGRVGGVVGYKLWGLAGSHQVLCITHLPQLAGYGDAHFIVHKIVEAGRTLTQVEELDVSARVNELAQMLGTESESTVQSAEELLEMVAKEKAATGSKVRA